VKEKERKCIPIVLTSRSARTESKDENNRKNERLRKHN
jgi:hypothetical protein